MRQPTRRRAERNAGAFLAPGSGVIPVPMRTLSDDYSDVPEAEDSDRVPRLEQPGLVHRLLPPLFLLLAGGVVLSVAAFWLTSTTPRYESIVEPCTVPVAFPGFDPWTGQPGGLTYDDYGGTCLSDPNFAWGNPTRVVDPVPDEMLGRQAIPLPVGFAVGSVITIVAIVAMRRRRRVEPPGRPSAVP
jgi:hypothetical protein